MQGENGILRDEYFSRLSLFPLVRLRKINGYSKVLTTLSASSIPSSRSSVRISIYLFVWQVVPIFGFHEVPIFGIHDLPTSRPWSAGDMDKGQRIKNDLNQSILWYATRSSSTGRRGGDFIIVFGHTMTCSG